MPQSISKKTGWLHAGKTNESLYKSIEHQFKNKKDNIYRKDFSQQTLQTLQPSITGSSWDTDSGDDPYWDKM